MTNFELLHQRLVNHLELIDIIEPHDVNDIVEKCKEIRTLAHDLEKGYTSMESLAFEYGKKTASIFGSNFTRCSPQSFWEPKLKSNLQGRKEFLICLSKDYYCKNEYENTFENLDDTVDYSKGFYQFKGDPLYTTVDQFKVAISKMTMVSTTNNSDGTTNSQRQISDQKLYARATDYLLKLKQALLKSKYYTPVMKRLDNIWESFYDADLLETQLSNLVNNIIDSVSMTKEALLSSKSALDAGERYITDLTKISGYDVCAEFSSQPTDNNTKICSAKIAGVRYFNYYNRMSSIQSIWLNLSDFE